MSTGPDSNSVRDQAERDAFAAIGRVLAAHPSVLLNRFDPTSLTPSDFRARSRGPVSSRSDVGSVNDRTVGPGDDPGADPGNGNGNGGTPVPTPKSHANIFWWGLQIAVVESDLERIAASANIQLAAHQIASSVLTPLAIGEIFISEIASFLSINSLILHVVDRGNGVYITMSWLAPGIFVPTAIS